MTLVVCDECCCGKGEQSSYLACVATSTGGEVGGADSTARSSNLPTTATMVGGTQLFEGAHLTGAHTHFCRNSGKCRDYALFGVIPSNVPPERFRI